MHKKMGEKHSRLLSMLSTHLSTAPILAYPDFTLMNNIIINTDASQEGIDAVLSQTGIERPIFVASRATTLGKLRYAPTALKALASVHYVEFFEPYVSGSSFKVVTDHRALVWLFWSQRSSMYLRWILRLQQYNFTVEYRPGKYNLVAYAVCRSPVGAIISEVLQVGAGRVEAGGRPSKYALC
jgi:hypothetical protein